MTNMEQAKSNIQTIEFMEPSGANDETQIIPVSEDIQRRIRRKVWMKEIDNEH
jgi:hypothetical protein